MRRTLLVVGGLLLLSGCVDVYQQKPAETTVVTPPSAGPTYVPPGSTSTVITRP
jgi:hypothetical protein